MRDSIVLSPIMTDAGESASSATLFSATADAAEADVRRKRKKRKVKRAFRPILKLTETR